MEDVLRCLPGCWVYFEIFWGIFGVPVKVSVWVSVGILWMSMWWCVWFVSCVGEGNCGASVGCL